MMKAQIKTKEKTMSSKQREALEQIYELLSIGGKPDTAMCIRYEAAFQIAKEALAEPMRNCDVGNVKEQEERMRDFCEPRDCADCQLRRSAEGCVLAWTQMPYEKVK